jgi:DNA-binding NarL/FixJ family response regulator
MTILTLPQRLYPTVLIVARPHRLADLDRHLPSDWAVTHRPDLPAGGRDPDLVVLDDPGPRAVTAACRRHPSAAIVVVLSPYSDHEDVVDVLEAGADACVRSGTAAVIAAHLEACQRRQAA